MKTFTPAKQIRESNLSFDFSISFRSRLNLLILLHVVFFVLYYIIDWNDWTLPWAEESIEHTIRTTLAVSSREEEWPWRWITSPFTFHFVHISVGELLLSMCMLWFFGHILKMQLEQWKVIVFYFVMSILSAFVFNLSHIIFPIFSGPGGRMEGAFFGVLAVMSAGVMLFGKHRFRIGRQFAFRLWHVYLVALLLSFVFVYRNNMAYILVYAFNMYVGIKYVQQFILREAKEKEEAEFILQEIRQ